MVYILWGLLNLVLLVFFIGICFRAAKLLRENIGLLASIVFVFGLLSFAGNSGNKNEAYPHTNNQVKKWTFTPDERIMPDTWKYVTTPIDKTSWLSTINLGIAYGREKISAKLIPLEATSTTTGFVSGHQWKPDAIIVDTTATVGKLRYDVSGLLEWNLLGTRIYTQSKMYSGFINVKVK